MIGTYFLYYVTFTGYDANVLLRKQEDGTVIARAVFLTAGSTPMKITENIKYVLIYNNKGDANYASNCYLLHKGSGAIDCILNHEKDLGIS